MDALAALQRLGNGRLIEDLHQAITDVSHDVIATGNPGSVTVSFRVTQSQPGEPMVLVNETIVRSVPKRKPRGAFFYSYDGELFKEDPRQVSMDLRPVESTQSEIRETDDPGQSVREVS